MTGAGIVYYGMSRPPGSGPAPGTGRPPGLATGGRARILIVEDEYLVGMALEENLIEAGYEVVDLVTTGEEAVRQGVALRPDLVLMDIRLAGEMNGIDAAVELRAHGIPSLFASAHTDDGTRAAGDRADPVGWLIKPFSCGQGVAAVAAALARLKHN